MLLERRAVCGLVEVRQNRRVNVRVQRLDPAVEHLWKSRHVFDIEVVDTGVDQGLGGTPRGDQVHA